MLQIALQIYLLESQLIREFSLVYNMSHCEIFRWFLGIFKCCGFLAINIFELQFEALFIVFKNIKYYGKLKSFNG